MWLSNKKVRVGIALFVLVVISAIILCSFGASETAANEGTEVGTIITAKTPLQFVYESFEWKDISVGARSLERQREIKHEAHIAEVRAKAEAARLAAELAAREAERLRIEEEERNKPPEEPTYYAESYSGGVAPDGSCGWDLSEYGENAALLNSIPVGESTCGSNTEGTGHLGAYQWKQSTFDSVADPNCTDISNLRCEQIAANNMINQGRQCEWAVLNCY